MIRFAVCVTLLAIAMIWSLRRAERWLDRQERKMPPPDYIGRPKKCANGVDGCGINKPHSHVGDFIRRLRNK